MNGLLALIQEKTNLSYETLFHSKGGFIFDSGLKEFLLFSIFLLHTFAFLLLFVIGTVRSLKNLGIYLLQGWSRLDFCKKFFGPSIFFSIFTIPLFLLYALYFTEKSFTSLPFLLIMVGVGLINVLLTFALASLSSVFIFLVKPVNAIRERYPKKMYLSIGLLIYLMLHGVMMGLCTYLDAPYEELKENNAIRKDWETASDFHIFQSMEIGDDQSSINYQSKKLYKDINDWYQSIHNEDGVYIIETNLFSKDLLAEYKAQGLYTTVPEESFWLFKLSPNYLDQLNIEISNETIEKALKGERVYLIPENKKLEEKERLKKWLKEEDTQSIREDDLDTVFKEKKEFQFIPYKSGEDFFTWSTEKAHQTRTKDPIILLLTPENMIYRENESLFAQGLDHSN